MHSNALDHLARAGTGPGQSVTLLQSQSPQGPAPAVRHKRLPVLALATSGCPGHTLAHGRPPPAPSAPARHCLCLATPLLTPPHPSPPSPAQPGAVCAPACMLLPLSLSFSSAHLTVILLLPLTSLTNQVYSELEMLKRQLAAIGGVGTDLDSLESKMAALDEGEARGKREGRVCVLCSCARACGVCVFSCASLSAYRRRGVERGRPGEAAGAGALRPYVRWRWRMSRRVPRAA